MSHFFKTELGQSALQQRNIALTARQRRLLLLIDHDDFKDLDKDYKERIAPTELVQQLIDMGLLAEQETRSNRVETKENQKISTVSGSIISSIDLPAYASSSWKIWSKDEVV